MCPSYMATREEKHSTRGRANTLRLAMAGTLGEAGLSDHDVHDVLDLCLECRACKAECPVGVDVARFKSEFLAGYWQRHGMPLRTRVDRPRARGVANGAAASRRCRTSSRRARSAAGSTRQLLGIDRRRTPPAFARETFAQRFANRVRHSSPVRQSAHPPASAIRHRLRRGSLQRHLHELQPSARSAWPPSRCLDAAGVGVRLVAHGCCGRPLISQGPAGRGARARRRSTPTRCSTRASRGERILFLEPSCLSAVREDAPALLRGEAQRKARGGRPTRACCSRTTSSRSGRRGGCSSILRPGPSTVLLHGHCHQKAMGLMPAARALLGAHPVVHRRRSRRRLLRHGRVVRLREGALRGVAPDRRAQAAAGRARDASRHGARCAGTSCREQVEHFTGVTALHPAQLLQSLLA